jgi:hypothetical protein
VTDPVGRSVDSHLGSWTYTTWSPAHLRPFVQEFGIFEGIVDARGAVSIRRLQEVAGGSASRLSRRFREHVGV